MNTWPTIWTGFGCVTLMLALVCCAGGTAQQADKEPETAIQPSDGLVITGDTQKDTGPIDTSAFIARNRTWAVDLWCLMEDPLEEKDLEIVPSSVLRIIRNELYAHYGYRFKSKDLQAYFKKKWWYQPLFDNVDRYLGETEKQNIALIRQYEEKNKGLSYQDFFEEWLGTRQSIPDSLEKLMHYYFGSAFEGSSCSNHYSMVRHQRVARDENKDIFVLYNEPCHCNESFSSISLRQYTAAGQLENQVDLGEMDSNERMDINGPVIQFKLRKTYFDSLAYEKDGRPEYDDPEAKYYEYMGVSFVPVTYEIREDIILRRQ